MSQQQLIQLLGKYVYLLAYMDLFYAVWILTEIFGFEEIITKHLFCLIKNVLFFVYYIAVH